MGFLNFGKSATPNQSQIIYTDNVRRKSSFSILVSAGKNETTDLTDISKQIDTFEENADKSKDNGNFIFDHNGNAMIFTDLGANFVFQEYEQEARTETPAGRTHKWIVFVSVCFLMMIDVGFFFVFGTLFPTILEEFGESRASTAAIQSVAVGVGPSSAIFTGIIAQRFGPRKFGLLGSVLFSAGLLVSWFAKSTVYLQVSYGIVSALGFSFLFISSNQILCQLFEGQTRLICISLVTCAAGVGSLFYPYFLNWLANSFGLNGTFLLLGAISSNTIPLTILWAARRKPRTSDTPGAKHSTSTTAAIKSPSDTPEATNSTSPTAASKTTTVQKGLCANVSKIITYKPFTFLFLGLGLTLSSVNMFDILAMDILSSNGLSREQSINAVIISSATSIPSRMLPGLMNKLCGCSSVMTPVIAALFGGCGIFLVILFKNFAGSAVACAVIGVARGGMVGTVSVVTLKVLGAERFSTGLGIIFGITGLATTGIGPVNGFLREISGTYTISLYAAAGAMLAGCALCFISLILHSRAKAKMRLEKAMAVFTVTRF